MDDDVDDDERLPPPHPRFAEHFTGSLYDGDDLMNDGVPPFGSDEGSDAVWEWVERIQDITAHPTLRYMLGGDADALVAELRTTSQPAVDDIMIGTGFALLRFSGQIDAESRGWLIGALQRQLQRSGSAAYETLLDDLATFDHHDAGLSSTRSTRTRSAS